MSNGPLSLDGDHKVKFELLKDHFKGVMQTLAALSAVGYVPDRFGSKDLAVAIDEVYAKIERRE